MNRAQAWPTGRLLFRTHLPFIVLAWGAFALFVVLVVAVAAAFRSISISGWDVAAGVVRWVALGYGAYLTGRLMPVCVAHGRTRREFLAQGGVFATVLVAVVAALMTLGYVLEGLAYRALDWPQRFNGDRLFTSSDDVVTIFVTHSVMLLGWMLVGAFLGAAFYRLDGGALLAIPVAVILVAMASVAVGYDSVPVVGDLIERLNAPVLATVALAVAAITTAAVLTWALLRDVPIKHATG